MHRLVVLAAVAALALASSAQSASDSFQLTASLTGAAKSRGSFAATLTGSALRWKLTFAGSARSAELAGGGRTVALCRPCKGPAKGMLTLSGLQAQLLERGKAVARIRLAAGLLSGKVRVVAVRTTRPVPATTTSGSGPAGSNWTATAVSLRGQNGNRFEFVCPPSASSTAGPVWGGGTEYFTDTSAVCPAAVITGDILLQAGGLVVIEIRPGQPSYAGTATNGITSQSFGASPGSFVVVHDS